MTRLALITICALWLTLAAAPAQTLPVYSIGNPTDDEQLWLETLNFERANPAAEAQLLKSATDPLVLASYAYFGVDLSAMVAAFGSISPAPPLSMNAELLASAAGHSQDMLANGYQGHIGSDGSTLAQRIAAQGYDAATAGENVYAFATSVFEGNAAFEVDWGDNPPTGMQDPPGHRENDHDAAFAEVGIGVIEGAADFSGTEFGPLVCTLDFATQQSFTPFVTGVVYYDVSGDGVYEAGEGLGGVAVNVSGASDSGSTANSGGYSVPVSGSGARTVTFSVSGAPDQHVATTLSGTSNVKVDLKLPFTPPVVSGTATPPAGAASTYQFTPLPGADSYQFEQSRLAAFTVDETGADGTGHLTIGTEGGYDVIADDEPYNGAPSFHLAHLTTDQQVLELDFTLIPSAASALKFVSLLGYATTTETAGAEISTDGGATWQEVWSQAGTGGAGESSFTARSVSLSQFAAKQIMVRFVYDSSGESYYNTASAGVGFYFDNIQVTDATELTHTVVADTNTDSSFEFEPTVTGTYVLAVRARAVDRYFPYGPDDTVVAVPGSGTGFPFAGFKGAYVGLIGTGSNGLDGILRLDSGATGSFTAGGMLGGGKLRFAGHFDSGGAYAATLPGGVQVQLQLATEQTAVVTGTVAAGGSAAAIILDPVEKAVSPAAFTFQLPPPSGAGLPQGIGFGAVRLPADSAAATFSGKLGDGTAIAYGGSVAADGSSGILSIPVYIPLYHGKGSVSGVLTRDSTAIGGALTWSKPATTGTYLPAAFTTQVDLDGSLYVKPPRGDRAIPLASGTVTFSGGGLTTSPLQIPVTLGTANKVAAAEDPIPDHFKMSVDAASGLFSGSFLPAGQRMRIPFAGALFQDGLNFGAGMFKGAAEPGQVEFQ